MDFSLSEDVISLRDLTADILTEQDQRREPSGLDHNDQVVQANHAFDGRAYKLLADAGVLGALMPEEFGGAGIDIFGAHQVLEQLGRRASTVPVLENIVCAGTVLVNHGSHDQQTRLIPGVVDGSHILTTALVEPGGAGRINPRTRARYDSSSESWLISGVKTQVPFVQSAVEALVPALLDDDSVSVFLVDLTSSRIEIEDQISVAQRPLGMLTLRDVPAEMVGEAETAYEELLMLADAGLTALQLGNCEAALRAAAVYTSARRQFGQPIGAFQAVRQRLADCWIDVEIMRLTSFQAFRAIGEQVTPKQVNRDLSIAKYWAADAAHRVLYAVQHVHGGVGIDLDFGLHRHFRLGKYIELTLGSANEHLRRLGSVYITK